MANAETEHHAPAGRIRNYCGGLGADIGVPKVDIGDPAADRDPLRRREQEVQALQEQVVAQELELRAAQARVEIALTVPRVQHAPTEPEKKTRRRRRR